MELHPRTLRITGLPHGSQPERLKKFIQNRLRDVNGNDLRIGTIHSHDQTSCCTITFPSFEAASSALRLEETSRQFGSHLLKIDCSFGLLTTLYSSDNPETGRPDVDIVAIHDLGGHPWYSFTSSEEEEYHDQNWLQTLLPTQLESNPQRPIYARVMTFGYWPNLWVDKSLNEIEKLEADLLQSLLDRRKLDHERPLFFIAHGLGGCLAKQAFVDLANQAAKTASESDSVSNVLYGGFVFFGVPNQVHDSTVLLDQFRAVYNLIGDLKDHEKKAMHIKSLASEFIDARELHNQPVFSFAATKPSNSLMLVEPDSAFFNYDGKPGRGILDDKDHFSMTRFSAAERDLLSPASSFLCESMNNVFDLQRRQMQGSGFDDAVLSEDVRDTREDKFSLLQEYDTVFLVDDSGSMKDAGKWLLVQRILAKATEITTLHDRDGIDINFFNNRQASKKHIRDAEQAKSTIQSVAPATGRTPTLRRLRETLGSYKRRFKNDQDIPKLNLIILTDGEPDKDHEFEDEISDAEDAERNSAANRKIRKEIVKTAEVLRDNDAPEDQVGIQWCQIGNDSEVAKFFQYLDNDLRTRYGVHDMVDTVRCINEQSLNSEFYLKLLTGAIDPHQDNQAQKFDEPQLQNGYAPGAVPSGPSQPRSWEPQRGRVSRQQTTSPGRTPPLATNFNDLAISDADYTLRQSPPTSPPGLPSSHASNSRYPTSPNRAHTEPTAAQGPSQPPKKHKRFTIFTSKH